MQLLTIDTKDNCYVINPSDMESLQKNVATSFPLEKGTFDIQITGGTYSYNKDETDGEPLVLLWIYGVDGNTFINKNTGLTVGTTWTTLNGYGDRLQLEVPDKAVLCALFFDIYPGDNSGTITLSVTSNKAGFTPQTLSVDSQKNCYSLSASYLNSLKQWGSNFVEIEPGNYRLKIQSSTASYWSENKKFQLEPWALLWMKSGTFTPQLTNTEVKETWCSLNGVNDEFVVNVVEKTTIAGFFFDTFKDDNEGQIILAIEPVTAEAPINLHPDIVSPPAQPDIVSITPAEPDGDSDSDSELPVPTPHPDIVPTPPQPDIVSITPVGPSGDGDGGNGRDRGGNGGGWITSDRRVIEERRQRLIRDRRERREREEVSFKFKFDDDNFDDAWKKILAKVESAITITGKDSSVNTQRWDQLETWLLKGYKNQAKELAIKVARLELMLTTFREQIEGNLQMTFSRWTQDFDGDLQALVSTQIREVTNVNLTEAIAQLKTNILDRVRQLIGGTLNVSKLEINTRTNAQLSTVKADYEQRLTKQVNRLHVEMTQAIDTQISTLITSSEQQLYADIAKLREELNHDANTRITNIQLDVEKTINVTEVISEEVSQGIRASVIETIDGRFSDIRDRIRQLEQEIDHKIERLRVDFRGDIIRTLLDQISELIEQKIKLEMTKVDFNTYLVEIDARANAYIDQLKQLEVSLIGRINQGDISLYNWTLEQLMDIKGCMADREVLVEQLERLSADLRARLDNAPCVQPTSFREWQPLPMAVEGQTLSGGR